MYCVKVHFIKNKRRSGYYSADLYNLPRSFRNTAEDKRDTILYQDFDQTLYLALSIIIEHKSYSDTFCISIEG